MATATKETKGTDVNAEAEMLGITKSKVKTTAYKGKKGVTEAMIVKEEARHAVLADKRLANRITKKKAEAKMKPIDLRRRLLTARLTKFHNKKQATNYRKEQIKAWAEELQIIKTNPKGWTPGCVRAEKRSLDDKVAAALRQKD